MKYRRLISLPVIAAMAVSVFSMTAIAEEAADVQYIEAGAEAVPVEVVSEEPVAAEPVAPEPAAAEPVAPEPVAAEPAAPEPAAAEPAAEEPAAPAESVPAEGDSAESAPAESVPEESIPAEEDLYWTEDVWQYDEYYTYYPAYDAFSGDADILEEEEVVRDDLEYNEFALKVLRAIITEDMTDEEKCKAVYDYVHEIPYVNVVYSQNWKENGYRMLSDRAGDCFGFYAASRLLLERLGYLVIELQNINGFKHVWCLVSIDGGATWRHFDPTCWSWGSDGDLCLVTDEELTEYGNRHQVGYGQLSHDWDREQAAADIRKCLEEHQGRELFVLYPEDSAQTASIQ